MVAVIRNTDAQPADELAGLVREADQLGAEADQAAAAGEPGQADAPALTNAQCLTMGLQIVRETLCTVAKVNSPKRTMDDASCQAVGEAVAPVLDKYGINLGNMAGDFMAELRALAVTVPIVLAVRSALLDELAAKRAKPIEPEAGQAAAPTEPATAPE